MTPGAYRALDGAQVFLLHLPAGYRAKEILAYHARDPEGLSEKSEGNRIWKALHDRGRPGGAGNQHRNGPGLGAGACAKQAGPRRHGGPA